VEPDKVHDTAIDISAATPGEYAVNQVSAIFSYLISGDNQKKGWSYISDPRGVNDFLYANDTLKRGEKAKCVGVGDCGDFAILMSALVESIGGTTRIVLASNNTTGGHAYAEVYLGLLNDPNSQVDGVINWLKRTFETDKIFVNINTSTKEVWLNLDWWPDEKGKRPGGPFFTGDKNTVLYIRENYKKYPLNLPEKANKPPKLISLTSDKLSPQDAGTTITWTAKARDPEDDQIFYKFFLRDDPVTNWTKNTWVWTTTENDEGDNKIEVQIRDGKHALLNGFDCNIVANFTITEPKPISQELTNQPPIITSLVSDRPGPQDVGTVVTWTVKAEDPDNDQILYRILLNGEPQGVWTGHNSWNWDITDANVGDNQVEVWVRDGKHKDQNGFDDRKSMSFAVTASKQEVASGESGTYDPSKWTENGNALFKEGSYEEALKCFEKAIQISPSYADAWYGKANVLGTQGKYEESLASLDKVMKIDPSNLAALNNKGAALYELGRYEDALACYDESIKKDPTYSTPWANKGEVLLKLGKNSEALDCSEKSLNIDSADAFTWAIKGKALTALGKHTEALECFAQSIKLNPQDADAWNNKGIVLEKLGRSSEAGNAYAKAKELGYAA